MGCGSSKVEDLAAVALCRERCAFVEEAIRQRFALSEAHVAYLQSLKAVGISLDRFFNVDAHLPVESPPVLSLPVQRKGDHGPDPPTIKHSRSDSSASHLHFHSSDDDEDGSGSESLKHHLHHDPNMNYSNNNNYMMKTQTAPASLIYTQHPLITSTTTTTQTMQHIAESSSSSSYENHDYYSYYHNYEDPNPYPVHENHSSVGGDSYQDYGGGGAWLPPSAAPDTSAWDFLNFPIESFEKYYYYPIPPYNNNNNNNNTPSVDSKEVREEEGIPDLEEDHDIDNDDDDEVVKEVVESGRTSTHSKPGGVSEEEEDDQRVAAGDEPHLQTNHEMLDKKVVAAAEETRPKDTSNAAEFKPPAGRGFKDDAEVVREIQLQFHRAFDSQTELLKFLEVGKVPYKQKHVNHHVSSKMLHLPPVSSPPSTSKSSVNSDPASIDADQELELMSKTLSSTLHKLYLWEKKLYEEVKVEEKIRVLHERKSRKLKRMDEEGVEPHKVDATRNLVRTLETKIRIAIQVVDKISVKINSLRDGELWPLLAEFIQGLTKMWKSMLECHHNQCQAIAEAKRLDAIAFHNQFSDARFEATRQLEHDLINWTLQFSYWISAQKGYVRALNNWLMKCLLYVPEETPDGIVPFSPSRIGAPPVFVVCNQWWQSLDGISEKEVIDSMRELASNVFQIWDRDKTEMRMKMLADKDERKIKSLDKEDQKIQKEIQALDKRMVLGSADVNDTTLTGHIVYHSETTKGGSLQASLRHVLEAMERFTASSLKVYEEILQRFEYDHLAREHEKVSQF